MIALRGEWSKTIGDEIPIFHNGIYAMTWQCVQVLARRFMAQRYTDYRKSLFFLTIRPDSVSPCWVTARLNQKFLHRFF
jgi:hypothetical protein